VTSQTMMELVAEGSKLHCNNLQYANEVF